MSTHKGRSEVRLYGAVGVGATKADAKAQAAERIQEAFRDEWDYAPFVQRFPQGEVGMVFRTLEGWQHMILFAGMARTACYGSTRGQSKREAQRALRRQVAQEYWSSDDEGIALLDSDDDEGRRAQRRYARFQRAYRVYKAQGLSEGECHRQACEARGAA